MPGNMRVGNLVGTDKICDKSGVRSSRLTKTSNHYARTDEVLDVTEDMSIIVRTLTQGQLTRSSLCGWRSMCRVSIIA